MSTASPTAFLIWSILSVIFLVFLMHHLWCYDKFRCLKWDSGRQPGAFRRLMTYSYLVTVPLLVLFSIGMTYVKFVEGWSITPDSGVFPMPVQMYSQSHRRWLFPLYFVFSAAWSLEIVTHLEELAFWLFMLHQSPCKGHWFSSWEYRFWCLGSLTSLVVVPGTTFLTRSNLEMTDAWVILVGSSGSTITTILFLYVLLKFPSFLRHIKSEGADLEIVVKLRTFYTLNITRIIFRLLFTLPFLAISVDAVSPGNHPVNSSVFWADFLLVMGGCGCFFSSAMTLVVFFPRSLIYSADIETKVTNLSNPPPKTPAVVMDNPQSYRRSMALSLDSEQPASDGRDGHPPHTDSNGESSCIDYQDGQLHPTYFMPRHPLPHTIHLTTLHPYVTTFTSPIDLVAYPVTPPATL